MRRVVVSALALAACPEPTPLADGACDEAEARLGRPVCVHVVPDWETWDRISAPDPSIDRVASSKWVAPARADAFLQAPLFVDVNAYALHWELLRDAFPEAYGGLTHQSYSAMVLDPDRRELYSGDLAEFTDGASTFLGFTVWESFTDPAALMPLDERRALYDAIAARVGPRPLVWVPNSRLQAEAAANWTDPGFPIRTLEAVPYEAYTTGTGIGTVRRYTLAQLAQAEAAAAFGYRDLLVLEEAPFDVQRPIAGAITGTRQGALSHLNVRSAARGTPNAHVDGAMDAFAAWEGQLVRLVCTERGYTVAPATLEEAEAHWAAIRPPPVDVPAPDLVARALVPLLDVPTATAAERRAAVARYGAKGANLAALYQRIPAALQLEGFVVPAGWYAAALERATWTVDLGGGRAEHSLAETIAAWHADPVFLADGRERARRLGALRDAIEEAPVDPALLEALAAQLLATYGRDDVAVRFRSSSNAEDALAFSGAGLYESATACLADDLDADAAGPSRCDPAEPRERGLSRALGKVWASTWSVGAWEERDWYGVDHLQVAMGVLVNTRSGGERANAVAFTAPPTGTDTRTLVNAQLGELEVVSADPGVWPEATLVELGDGVVVEIVRVAASSEVAAGEHVLDDARITELALALQAIARAWPVDEAPPPGREVLLDTEWKVLADGRLVVKQVRPFLR